MKRIMPEGRSYGTIGPHQFNVWANLTGIESVGGVDDKKVGICNGFEWPLSMVRCHEGHLARLLNAAKYLINTGMQLVRMGALGAPHFCESGKESIEVGVVRLKILLGEKTYLHMMGPVMSPIFSEAESLYNRINEDGKYDNLDPIDWYTTKWGELPDEAASIVAA